MEKCEKCGYTTDEFRGEYEHDGKYTGDGDHAICDGCGRLMHIDYDVEEANNGKIK